MEDKIPTLEEKYLKDIIEEKFEIPIYQRPYKWRKEHVIQLLDDLYENIYLKNDSIYRVGSIIIHDDNKTQTKNIVDGQQRLTTLSMILFFLNSDQKLLSNQNHNLEISKNNIKFNYSIIKEWFETKQIENTLFLEKILSHCQFIVIIVHKQDEAFQLFDSQNSRGKPLYPHDLLKAFHLREMEKNGSKQDEMEFYSTKWEYFLLKDENPLLDIINNHLFRIRKWAKGERNYYFSKKDLNEFKGISLYKKNKFNYERTLRFLDGAIENSQNNQILRNFSMAQQFPFQINMPIINGKNFFDYIFHYIELKELLFTYNKNSDFLKFNQQWKEYYGWWRSGDEKVCNLYQNICLHYVDRFGLDYFGVVYYHEFFKNSYQLRLDNKAISDNSILNYYKAQKFFHLISNCYIPEELHPQLFCNYSNDWKDDGYAKGVKPIHDFLTNNKITNENE